LSPSLDVILGGGIPLGTFCVFASSPKYGKTTAALHFLAKAQQKGCKTYYVNIEGRLKRRDLIGIKGLDPNKVEIIGSFYDEEKNEGKILTAEEYLTIVENIVNNERRCVVVMDSVSQLCSNAEMIGGVGDKHRGGGLLSLFTKKICNVLPVNQNVIIAITHLVYNTSGMGSGWFESGGRKVAYTVDVKLRANQITYWKVPGNDEPIGQIVEWETHSTALPIAPHKKCLSYIRYGTGIDEIMEYIELGVNTGFIDRAGGGWHTLKYLEGTPKFQGVEKVQQYLLDNPPATELLQTNIKGMLGI